MGILTKARRNARLCGWSSTLTASKASVKRGESNRENLSEQWEAIKLLSGLLDKSETRFYRCESNFNSLVTIHFLRSFQEVPGEDLIVVLDTAPYRLEDGREFVEDAGLDLCYLSRYSLQLIRTMSTDGIVINSPRTDSSSIYPN